MNHVHLIVVAVIVGYIFRAESFRAPSDGQCGDNRRSKPGRLSICKASPMLKLKQLEDENRKLKHVVADLTLDNRALKDVLSRD